MAHSKEGSRGEVEKVGTCNQHDDGRGDCHEDPSRTEQGIGEEEGRQSAQPVTDEAPGGCTRSCCSNCRADHHLLYKVQPSHRAHTGHRVRKQALGSTL